MPRVKQPRQSKYWPFTYFYGDRSEIEKVEMSFRNSAKVEKFIWGEEVCPETGRDHLQGFIVMKGKKGGRPSELEYVEPLTWNSFHWEKAKKGVQRNVNYCTKDETNVVNVGFEVRRPLAKITKEDLYERQLAIADKYLEPEDSKFGRQIHWYWESKGGWGKSLLATYMIDQMDALELCGAAKDAFHGLVTVLEKKDVPIIIFDIPRCCAEYISYTSIEKIKDGKLFSPKYEGGMKRFNRPHVIVFANQEPNYEKMSEDRWVVTQLDEGSFGETSIW